MVDDCQCRDVLLHQCHAYECEQLGGPLMDTGLHLFDIGLQVVLCERHARKLVQSLADKLARQATENAESLYQDLCPTTGREDCPMCNGESCRLCGAEHWADCEHDVVDRHRQPPEPPEPPLIIEECVSCDATDVPGTMTKWGRLPDHNYDYECEVCDVCMCTLLGNASRYGEGHAGNVTLAKGIAGATNLILKALRGGLK